MRGVQGNFFQGIRRQATELPSGAGLEIIQSFDPLPLYEVMEDLGYAHHTEQTGAAEFHAYFYRAEEKEAAQKRKGRTRVQRHFEDANPIRPGSERARSLNRNVSKERVDEIKMNRYWDNYVRQLAEKKKKK